MKTSNRQPNTFNTGFTLIELLVVVSIISLLSSIILATIGDARDKAKAKALRQEMMQFVNALELYKTDNGIYPGEPNSTFSYYKSSTGTTLNQNLPNFENTMSPYIQETPTPNSGGFYYYHSAGLRCNGDPSVPRYAILVQSTNEGFEDWPYYTWNGTEYTAFRCFSIR